MQIRVIAADGTESQTASEADLQLAHAAVALIQADSHAEGKSVQLSQVEVNRALKPTEQGYLYLRVTGLSPVPQEFWAHHGAHARVAWKSGQVTVPASAS
ncbi:hypothetical protein [Deinococcus sonorensis]|uniref:Uncharacterized protein n=1 Tax=Deinococcus sonorensis TaxID=309891 RepID=A0ABV8YB93_9DEIO